MSIIDEHVTLGPALGGFAASLLLGSADRAEWAADRIGRARTPLPRLVWNAVVLRDRRVCQVCQSDTRRAELRPEVDHIVPWSAGGADHPVNLRTLCQPCNQARSNRTTGDERRARVIVFCCGACSTVQTEGSPLVVGFCTTCRSSGSVPFLAYLLIGGQVPGPRHCPAAGPDDPIGPAWEGLVAQRVVPALKERALAQFVACPWCGAPAGSPCVGSNGPLTRSSAHPARVDQAKQPGETS